MLFSEPKIPQWNLKRSQHQFRRARFSALQRAENSSMLSEEDATEVLDKVSVLFSEPKIPQWMW